MNRDSASETFRILAIVNLPWDPRLGAARVWIELSEEWRKAGHTVEKFCLTDAFPSSTSSRGLSALRQAIFPSRAAAFVRKNAHRFDIIDCLIGTLPFSKESLGFNGLFVARSVGSHRLYDRFNLLSRERWPDQPKGRLLGSLFHNLRAHRQRRNSDEAIRRCDLLNVPNESELEELETNVRIHKPAIIEPYGLSDQHRAALRQAAQPAGVRLAKKKICFIGMWSLRKGSRDWPEIMRRIWAKIPDARFAFLGTMFSEDVVLSELGLQNREQVECIATFDPAELPELLGDCAIGLFPSYIEGFGLAVLEQLAAAIPTIAYDVPGPRQILSPLREALLCPPGDAETLARQAIEILQMDSKSYAALGEESLAIAANYSWPKIATETLSSYRAALRRKERPILFIQPFGLQSIGGGARIMRALLQDAPLPVVSISTAPPTPPIAKFALELHVPLRPDFGRIEKTRFAGIPEALTPLFAKRFTRKLESVCTQSKARAIHAIAHGGLDFYHAFFLSKKLGLPFFLHLHDDFVYSARSSRGVAQAEHALQETWQDASARFVISSQLGDEYCRRYGTRDYTVITDGADHVAEVARRGPRSDLRIYFMGLFHLEYEANFRSLLDALAQLRSCGNVGELSVSLRCGGVRRPVLRDHEAHIAILPFGSEADVQTDLQKVDLLYLPLPFLSASQPLVRFSLSTKLVTYLGSGLPILYHGPEGSAVCDLLTQNDAAFFATAPGAEHVRKVLQDAIGDRERGRQIATNGLELARSQFMLGRIRESFWTTINAALTK